MKNSGYNFVVAFTWRGGDRKSADVYNMSYLGDLGGVSEEYPITSEHTLNVQAGHGLCCHSSCLSKGSCDIVWCHSEASCSHLPILVFAVLLIYLWMLP